MTDPAETEPTLPGLELHTPGTTASALRLSVQRTIEALDERGLLEPAHEALCQLALELADAVAKGRSQGRASAVAMAAAQLRETLQALPEPATMSAHEAFAKFVEEELARND